MLKNRYVIGGGIIVILILANIINYLCSGWGLITVRVTDAPLAQVLKTIERQGWVTIYSDVDSSAKVTMDVIEVPLPEAMATLCANITIDRPPGTDAPGGGTAGGPPGGDGNRPPGGRDRDGGFGGGASWRLGFFAAPTSAKVKDEIRNFQAGSTGDETRIYSYTTPLDMISGTDTPQADPRSQTWPGYTAPPVPVTPVAGTSTDGQPAAAPAPPAAPSTVQDYLKVMAEESDIWIMAPADWDTHVSSPPSAGSSIISAVKSLVGSAHGSVEHAIILTSRHRGGGRESRGGGGFAGGDTGWSYTEERMRTAISGLPPENRAEATDQLNSEVKFMHDVQAAPSDQRRQMMMNHFMNHMGENDFRRSPEKRAARYARAVANRQSAHGQ